MVGGGRSWLRRWRSIILSLEMFFFFGMFYYYKKNCVSANSSPNPRVSVFRYTVGWRSAGLTWVIKTIFNGKNCKLCWSMYTSRQLLIMLNIFPVLRSTGYLNQARPFPVPGDNFKFKLA